MQKSCNRPREQIKKKSEKKRYFLTKMIEIRPEGTPLLFTFLFSFFSKGVLQSLCNTPFALYVGGTGLCSPPDTKMRLYAGMAYARQTGCHNCILPVLENLCNGIILRMGGLSCVSNKIPGY